MTDHEISRQILEQIPRIMRFIRSEMREHAKGQLTVPQFRILLKMTRERQTHKEVADWLGVTPATLTRMVDTLVKRKLANRETDPKDRRQTYLVPTTAGKNLSEKYLDRVNSILQGKINAINQADKIKLRDGLKILALLFPEA